MSLSGLALSLIALMVTALICFGSGWKLFGATSRPEACMDAVTREKARGLMLDAIDEALKDHIRHLYGTWMKDDTGQPERAARGTKQGLRAFSGARASVLQWQPPSCN